MVQVAGWIDRVLDAGLKGEGALAGTAGEVREQVRGLCGKFALPA
jgi:hypothetical protein